MDRRELILQRLVEIAEGLTGVATVTRNRLKLDDQELPAVCILDGDETSLDADEAGTANSNGRFQRMVMVPEIVIKVSDLPETVGPALNALRLALIPAVLLDAELAALHKRAGKIRIAGTQTQLAYGRSMQGEIAVQFPITYVLDPAELV